MTGSAAVVTAFATDSILCAPTPAAWVEAAVARWPQLLVDHAACEKKAASSAVALIFAYPEDTQLALALSPLAREELRHFEQVQRLMLELEVANARQRPGRYAHELRGALRTTHAERKLDLLLSAALIEARSAERFALLDGRLPAPLAALYSELASCEARHFELYVSLARACNPGEWRRRLAELAALEARLATAPDRELRFHSGPPAGT
ncbi:MAG TPA: tRNA isopentenyl-2-thiomethyl-A-37 hydroxylase MiaE [Steroidobacteraceae bacterium]|jgi:tRNA-(ms[2]io[6]A)-hydroxylase|nr:tRNA isopentenyl-2-thiomethyl-A-37 hydroxylase MiaE [Steroidobacteraceae bacterium]